MAKHTGYNVKPQRKVAGKRRGNRNPTSVYLTPEDRADIEKLARLKYGGNIGPTQVMRVEGMMRIREEIARIQSEEGEVE